MPSPLPRRSDWVLVSLTSPAVSTFPVLANGSACATTFSRIAQRSLTLRPAHSPSHQVTLYTEGFSHFVTSMTAPIATGWSESCRVGLHPLRNAALSRRTPMPVIGEIYLNNLNKPLIYCKKYPLPLYYLDGLAMLIGEGQNISVFKRGKFLDTQC